jgi:ABC-type transporter MlaC component
MANRENEDGDRWERMMVKLHRLAEKVEGVDAVQQQLMVQAELAATVAQKAVEERVQLAQCNTWKSYDKILGGVWFIGTKL